MKQALYLCFLFAALLGTSCATCASETLVVTFDGAWWTELTYADKMIAVQGMLVGYHGGYLAATLEASVVEAQRREHLNSPKMLSGAFMRKVGAGDTVADRTFQNIVQELDNYFEHHPERSHTLVTNEMYCALHSGQHCM